MKRESFLIVDDRLSGGGLFEAATTTCSHCQRIVVLNPDRTRERGYCRKCVHYICDECVTKCVAVLKQHGGFAPTVPSR